MNIRQNCQKIVKYKVSYSCNRIAYTQVLSKMRTLCFLLTSITKMTVFLCSDLSEGIPMEEVRNTCAKVIVSI